MHYRYQSSWIILFLLIAAILVVGCATTKTPYWTKTAYGTWSFSHADVKKLPSISIRNILSSVSENEHEKVQILIKAQNLDGIAEVKRISGRDNAIVTDAHGQELQIRIAEITEIQTIRHIKIRPREKTSGNTAEAVGEGLIYAPLIPVAIATWPLLRAMGLDANKNAEDKEKAMMAYGGMSKEDLIAYIGKPKEKYYCKGEHGDQEIWIYEKSKILRGGRSLFINLDDGMVYYTSQDTNFFKNSKYFNCSVLRR